MLIQSKQFNGAQIISLHTGLPVGSLGEIILNPNRLEVVGFHCSGPWQQNKEQMILLTQDIRQTDPKRVFINSVDELSSPDDLLRLQELLKINFRLIEKPVKTVSKHRLGKVEEYVVNTDTFEVQKIYVKQSLLKSMSMHSLVIDREQIMEVSDSQITVSDAYITKPAVVPQVSV